MYEVSIANNERKNCKYSKENWPNKVSNPDEARHSLYRKSGKNLYQATWRLTRNWDKSWKMDLFVCHEQTHAHKRLTMIHRYSEMIPPKPGTMPLLSAGG